VIIYALSGKSYLISFISASGFIGLPAAQALVRAGHYVIGLTRTQAKAKLLASEESQSTSLQKTIVLD